MNRNLGGSSLFCCLDLWTRTRNRKDGSYPPISRPSSHSKWGNSNRDLDTSTPTYISDRCHNTPDYDLHLVCSRPNVFVNSFRNRLYVSYRRRIYDLANIVNTPKRSIKQTTEKLNGKSKVPKCQPVSTL